MSTKRLTEEQYKRSLALAQAGRADGPESTMTMAAHLRAQAHQSDLDHDHAQAREDVKRLAAMLCWAVDRDLFRNEDEEKDGEVRAFLREVEAVRQ